ncbi:penicillin amidase [Ktedonobacter sp. SOSP1-52]|nr:penicillin amidase [Ktedonobacter sp. SOSP1-52]
MEQQRRVASARMAEIAGSAVVDIDRWVCRLGLKEAVDAAYNQAVADTDLMKLLQQYSNGVNYYLSNAKDLGVEIALLNVQPEPWTPKDTIRIITLVSWSLAGNWEEQLVRCYTLASLGPEQAALLEADAWAYDEKATYHRKRLADGVRDAFVSLAQLAEILPAWQEVKQQANLLPRRSGSNAWVISGVYTEAGKPILAADPHMPLSLPGFFYECHLKTGANNLNVAGAALAGIPGIIIGRNASFAWSITVAGAITAELRLERKADKPVRTIQHEIKVKGQATIIQTVAWGARGPLLSDGKDIMLPKPAEDACNVSLEWVGHRGDDAPGTLWAIWGLNRAQSVEELRNAAKEWGGPVLNLVWAEIEKKGGAFGWRVMGKIPARRNPVEGLLPAPAWESIGQWADGYIPADELPEEISPARGYVVSANNRMAPPDYPFVLSHEYMSAYRAERIEELVKTCIEQAKEGRHYTIESAQNIQVDQTSNSALALRNRITSTFAASSSLSVVHPLAEQALHLLQCWDGKLSADSAAGAMLKMTEDHLYRLIAKKLFGDDTVGRWLGVGHTPLNPSLMGHWRMREVILSLMVCLLPEFQAISAQDWQALVQEAFVAALDELSQQQGNIVAIWRWGQLHQLELVHPLVQAPLGQRLPPAMRVIKKLFMLSRGPFPLGGDEHTPWQASSYPVPAAQASNRRRLWVWGYQPAWRMIATDNGLYHGCLPGGVSGHGKSRWADNQLQDYLAGRLHQHSLYE